MSPKCKKSEHEMILLLAMNVTPRLLSSVCPKNPPPVPNSVLDHGYRPPYLQYKENESGPDPDIIYLYVCNDMGKQSITWLSPILRDHVWKASCSNRSSFLSWLRLMWRVFCFLCWEAKISLHCIKKCSFHSDYWEIQNSMLFRDNSELFGNHLWQSFHAL